MEEVITLDAGMMVLGILLIGYVGLLAFVAILSVQGN